MLKVNNTDTPPLLVLSIFQQLVSEPELQYSLITGRSILLKIAMDKQGLATNIPPLFTRDNYAYWSVRMKFHIMALGYKVWRTVEI